LKEQDLDEKEMQKNPSIQPLKNIRFQVQNRGTNRGTNRTKMETWYKAICPHGVGVDGVVGGFDGGCRHPGC
jgi:hypothetical protein